VIHARVWANWDAMTAQRSQSYAELMAWMRELAGVKLHADEEERIRDAADTLVLATETGGEVDRALADVEDLAAHLVDTGRWEPDTARRLVDGVAACGPEPAFAF